MKALVMRVEATCLSLFKEVQCSSDISEPKYTRNTRQPNTRIRVYIYANARMHIRIYAYTVYARMPH